MRTMKYIFAVLSVLLLSGSGLRGADAGKVRTSAKVQAVLSTNVIEWANFGTINLQAGLGVSQHFSFSAGVDYNPWEFRTGRLDLPLYNKQTTVYLGARWWPWYVFSGWWIGVKAQFSDYAETGIWRPALDTGQAVGAGLSFGYTFMLHEKLNIEFGAGVWGGRKVRYNLYCCPECMDIRDSGARNFVGLDDLSISIMYVF